jgi:guanylate kinase
MKKSKSEISHWGEYDYVLINDSLDVTSKAIKNILCGERMRRSRQPKLVEHVRNLQNEYNEIESKS